MNQPPEQINNSALLPFRNHTALLLCTALPYLQPAYRHPVELALKFLEFSETLKLYQEFHMQRSPLFSGNTPVHRPGGDSGLFGLINTFVFDLEGLLNSLSKVCTGDEKELVGMFLNLIRAKNFYDTYGDLLKSQFTDMDGLGNLFSGFNMTPQNSSTQNSDGQKAPFSPDLSSMLNSEQQETLELLKSLFSDELEQ